MVVLSHLTRNAFSGVSPIRDPTFHKFVRNWVTTCVTLAQSFSLFGSKTTHRVPCLIDSSRKRSKRRTLMYLKRGSFEVVRAPQTRKPRSVNSLMQFIPRGFSKACCVLLI